MNATPIRMSTTLAAAVLALAALPASAQPLQHDRGTILNIDLRTRQVEIKDAKDRERIWPFAADATVKFSDKAWQNRGSTLKDLRKGMYVHFRYKSGDPEVIQEFDVKDIGQGGGGGGSADNSAPPPPAAEASERVAAVDRKEAQTLPARR